MSDRTAEEMARRFHDTYERLAPEHGYETDEPARVFRPDSPNGRLMIAVCAELFPEPQSSKDGVAAYLRDAQECLRKAANGEGFQIAAAGYKVEEALRLLAVETSGDDAASDAYAEALALVREAYDLPKNPSTFRVWDKRAAAVLGLPEKASESPPNACHHSPTGVCTDEARCVGEERCMWLPEKTDEPCPTCLGDGDHGPDAETGNTFCYTCKGTGRVPSPRGAAPEEIGTTCRHGVLLTRDNHCWVCHPARDAEWRAKQHG